MTSRVLPEAEWAKLDGIVPICAGMVPIVVEHAGQIVGCHVLIPMVHVEGLWIHPDHRKKASVARRLWGRVQRVAVEQFGVRSVATAACSDDIKALLKHIHAVPLPGDHFLIPVEVK